MSATKTTIVAILVLVVTFTAGIAVGVFGSHVMMRIHGRGPLSFPTGMMVNHLDRRLDLTDKQRAQVEEIVRRHHDAIASMWSQVEPRVRVELEEANDEITRILTPEQRRKFARMKLQMSPRAHRSGRAQTESTK